MSLPYDRRRSLRLADYDYSQIGAYFITVCVRDRAPILGAVLGGTVQLSDAGRVVADSWMDLERRWPSLQLDAFAVMPNHVHGVLFLAGTAEATLPKCSEGAPCVSPALGDVVGAFKSVAARNANRLLGRRNAPFWQRNYFEHVIRNDAELERIRAYIEGNPADWELDRENPKARRTETSRESWEV